MQGRIDGRITVRFDGGSRGNPGPAAIGVVLEADDGTAVFSVGRPIGRATNNVAEYTALVAGLQEARRLGVRHVRVLGDSELVIKQILGEYRVKNEALKPLYEQAVTLLRGFERTEVGHNRRSHNSLADALANLAMDRERAVSEEDLPAGGVDGGGGDEGSDDGSDDGTDGGAAGVGLFGGPGGGAAGSTRAGGVGVVGSGAGKRESQECPRCGCRVEVVKAGEVPVKPRRFVCRCGTPMRPA